MFISNNCAFVILADFSFFVHLMKMYLQHSRKTRCLLRIFQLQRLIQHTINTRGNALRHVWAYYTLYTAANIPKDTFTSNSKGTL